MEDKPSKKKNKKKKSKNKGKPENQVTISFTSEVNQDAAGKVIQNSEKSNADTLSTSDQQTT